MALATFSPPQGSNSSNHSGERASEESDLGQPPATLSSIEDLRKETITHRDNPKERLPSYTQEQINSLKSARKEVMEFYNSLQAKAKGWFLVCSDLECVDRELWLELVSPHMSATSTVIGSDGRFRISEKLKDNLCRDESTLGSISKEIICDSDLPLKKKLPFLGPKDVRFRLLLIDSLSSDRDIVHHHQMKQFLLRDELSHEREFWVRRGVLSLQEISNAIDDGTRILSTKDLRDLSPKTLSRLEGLDSWFKNTKWIDDPEHIKERLKLTKPFSMEKTGELKAYERHYKELQTRHIARKRFITPEITHLWNVACNEGGITPYISLTALAEDEVLGSRPDTPARIASFLRWWNQQPIDQRSKTYNEILAAYEVSTGISLNANIPLRPLAWMLSTEPLQFRQPALRQMGAERVAMMKTALASHGHTVVPKGVRGLSDYFDTYHQITRSWLKDNQDEFLQLLQQSLAIVEECETNTPGKEDTLTEIHAGALFLREFRPRECAALLLRIQSLPEYAAFTGSLQTPHRAVVYAAYQKVITLSKESVALHRESTLFDSNHLSWELPAGNRWIFMEGLEMPSNTILVHAIEILKSIARDELNIEPSNRIPRSTECCKKIERVLSQLKEVAVTALGEEDRLYLRALTPLYQELLLWANREKEAIEAIIAIQNSGLARPADEPDRVRVAPGNHYDFIQKAHKNSPFDYVYRECPVLNFELYKSNLLALCQASDFKPNRGYLDQRLLQHSPQIPKLTPNAARLFTVSEELLGDARYLTAALSSRMVSDYSFEPMLSGALADFLTKLPKAATSRAVTLSAELAGNGTTIPCPHHGVVNQGSLRSSLGDTSLTQNPDGSFSLVATAGFGELEIQLSIPTSTQPIAHSASISEVKNALPSEIYSQLTDPIALLGELPTALQDAIIKARSMTIAEGALFLEHFVQENYVFSFDVVHSEAYRRFQQIRQQGEQGERNAYLEMIHSVGDSTCLGKGVCGQLSTVLFASLRLAGIPCLRTSGYLADGTEVDENMFHAYVSALLPTEDGNWTLKVLEATGGGAEGFINFIRRETLRLRKLQTASDTPEVTPFDHLKSPPREERKWGWLDYELSETSSLTNDDAHVFYTEVTRCRGLKPNIDPTACDVADSYSALLGSVDESVFPKVEERFSLYPQLQPLIEKAKRERLAILERILGEL